MNRAVTFMVSTSGRPGCRRVVVGPFVLWTGTFLLLALFGGAIWTSAYVYRIYSEALRIRVDYEALQSEHTRLSASYDQLQDRLAAIEELESKVRFVFDLSPPEEAGLIESTNGQGGGPEPPTAIDDSYLDVTDSNDASEAIEILSSSGSTYDPDPPNSRRTHPDGALVRAERLLRSWIEIDEKKVRSQEDLALVPSVTPLDPRYPRYVSSPFGPRSSPFTGRPEFHGGIDISARTGTPVIAPADGVVAEIWSEQLGGALGNAIKIRHVTRGATFDTLYGHLRRRSPFAEGLHVGSVVKRHQVIGYVGDTGHSTAPHLHYEVRKDGKRANPFQYLMDR